MFPEDIQALAHRVVAAGARTSATIVTAESCTGGLVAGALTGVAGSSAVVDRGFVTYSNAAKSDLLGVDPQLIVDHGAVSEPVVRAMAEGARRAADAFVALAVTGIAGPGGGSPDKPVGLVHFATATRARVEHACLLFGDLGRDGVRLASVRTALQMLLSRLEADA